MVFQKAVLATEVALAEAAVANDALSGITAVLGGAANLLCRHDGDLRGWCVVVCGVV